MPAVEYGRCCHCIGLRISFRRPPVPATSLHLRAESYQPLGRTSFLTQRYCRLRLQARECGGLILSRLRASIKEPGPCILPRMSAGITFVFKAFFLCEVRLGASSSLRCEVRRCVAIALSDEMWNELRSDQCCSELSQSIHEIQSRSRTSRTNF